MSGALAAITAWEIAHPDCGKIVHGVGVPRVLRCYRDDLQMLRTFAGRFPWPDEAFTATSPAERRQMLLF